MKYLFYAEATSGATELGDSPLLSILCGHRGTPYKANQERPCQGSGWVGQLVACGVRRGGKGWKVAFGWDAEAMRTSFIFAIASQKKVLALLFSVLGVSRSVSTSSTATTQTAYATKPGENTSTSTDAGATAPLPTRNGKKESKLRGVGYKGRQAKRGGEVSSSSNVDAPNQKKGGGGAEWAMAETWETWERTYLPQRLHEVGQGRAGREGGKGKGTVGLYEVDVSATEKRVLLGKPSPDCYGI